MTWRFVNAAVRGTSHERGDVPCQDDCLVDLVPHEDGEVLIGIVSDGAGSAACSQEGSGLVCEVLVRAIEQWVRAGHSPASLTRDTAEEWVSRVRTAIEQRAAQQELTPRDFACTLAAAVVGPADAAFLQIGDGAIVTGTAETYEVIFWPDGGEYANMTYFATDADWAAHLHFEVRQVVIEHVALMTDGLQRLALTFETRSAHAPFFTAMFHALHGAGPGLVVDLVPALVAFLGSEGVNARTDDDKSLVLATRSPGASDAAAV